MKRKQEKKQRAKAAETLEMISNGYIAILVTLFLLYTGDTGYLGISETKRDLYYVTGILYVIVTLIVVFWSLWAQKLRKDYLRQQINGCAAELTFAIAYLLVTLISALCSRYGKVVWLGASRQEGACTITLYVLTFCCLALFFKPKDYLIHILGISVTVFCTIAILQFSGANPLHLYPNGMDYRTSPQPFIGTVGNVAFVAAFLCIAIPVILGTVLLTKLRYRFWLIIPLSLSFFTLIKISVLAGYVGIAMSMFFLIPLVARIDLKTYGVFACVLLFLAIAIVYFISWTSGLAYELNQLLHGNVDPRFGSGRIYIWTEVLRRVPEALLIGHGPDTMRLAGIEPFSRYDVALKSIVTSEIDVAHNEYLNVLFHQGILGLISYLGLTICIVIKRIKKKLNSSSTAILMIATVSYLSQAMFGISQVIVAPFFWALLGCLTRLSCADR